MYVWGGNPHNDTVQTAGTAKCYSAELMVYNTRCYTWKKLISDTIPYDSPRYGHSSVTYNNSMIIFGGFSGKVYDDIIIYSPYYCDLWLDELTCVSDEKCFWSDRKQLCMSANVSNISIRDSSCGVNLPCQLADSCTACDAYNPICTYCDKSQCNEPTVKTICGMQDNNCTDSYYKREVYSCELAGSCHECKRRECSWVRRSISGTNAYLCVHESKKKSDDVVTQDCPATCAYKSSCNSCVRTPYCMWCKSENRCVSSAIYPALFSFGQCLAWTSGTCKGTVFLKFKLNIFVSCLWLSQLLETQCESFTACDACQAVPGCGWCESNITGVGKCISGRYEGPIRSYNGYVYSRNATVDYSACDARKWLFASCPACQCNGHSTCINGSVCRPCRDNTRGKNCEYCLWGFYGRPVNGGTCSACNCNGHSWLCDTSTGICENYCTMEGNKGSYCERCDTSKYTGSAANGGYCYLRVAIDSKVNVSIQNQRITNFHFTVTPTKPDRNVKLTVEVEEYRLVPTIVISVAWNIRGSCDSIHRVIAIFSYIFCIKQRLDRYRRRQERMVELKQMANRPFSSISFIIERYDNDNSSIKKQSPSQVALQPVNNGEAGIMSVLMRLPGEQGNMPGYGQSALAFGSALIVCSPEQQQLLSANKRYILGRKRKAFSTTTA
ncbi:uncharacterized protein TRIADDRAFT_58624 [Trichoplax adhaerens]|uniref:Laminin EGF-like domain-containing protein n=1 Tax=Trichoplax adhaerens TaxID=10228 RepID=B3S377_TRIAD|nr:hypothetical protein TRIADDRAFT_58624 [Trichoplax adhaerens]EDV22742.1 hypothetical protein TRIADDRAFT_58624 [Trichoplax adhaerens]|eukprot:XP_002114608.1 hypothetical protein TRIADDRAFT_58624 [Trichoplax adhaerens]